MTLVKFWEDEEKTLFYKYLLLEFNRRESFGPTGWLDYSSFT